VKTLSQPVPFPPGVTNANWFSFYNAVSFQIFLGSPMILYAKRLGASATLLGVIASLTPLLVIFQIPAAHHLQRFGYRRFVLAGWSTRNLCVFAVVVVPLLGFLTDGWKLALVMGFLFLFNLLRGITSGAWLPWLTEIIPEEIRPRFLSRDQRFLQSGSVAALLFCGLTLQKESQPWEFSLVFLFSAIGGAISLHYLSRMPDVQKAETLKKNGTLVPWRQIVTYPPFARLVGFNLLLTFATGSLAVFTVAFLKDSVGMGENHILYLMAMSFIAGVGLLDWVGRRLEVFGSKRILSWGLLLYLGVVAGWTALALGLIAPGIGPLLLIFAGSGIAGASINLANSHLLMRVMPQRGRSHFFAFYSVITSLGLGVTPIIWGACLDAMKGVQFRMGSGWEWNHYSIYFAALLVLVGASFFACRGVDEKQPRASEVE